MPRQPGTARRVEDGGRTAGTGAAGGLDAAGPRARPRPGPPAGVRPRPGGREMSLSRWGRPGNPRDWIPDPTGTARHGGETKGEGEKKNGRAMGRPAEPGRRPGLDPP
ncbi:hypothetical protein GCM10010246_59920 [Streptomyces cuspidosporus]|uniref:Uncharacterized protein n=1 Tax=Streptomyces cuspidosporus TaxID=66882 RepID=A0ABP5TTG8_9ACTN